MGTETTASDRDDRGTKEVLNSLWWSGLCAFVVAVISLALAAFQGWWAALGIGLLIVVTSAAVGSVLGFLFAIPRILTTDPKVDPPADTGVAASVEDKKRKLASNSNLDRISDWLTTMIVGVGLSQINQVNAALLGFRNFIAETVKPCAGGTCALPGVSPMLLIFGLVGGFIAFYLFTRLKLSKLFQQVEDELDPPLSGAPAERVKEVATELSQTAGASENPAVQAVLASSQPSVDESLRLMLSLLYRDGGFQQVIDLGGQLSNSVAARRAEYWFYLAAAFGQKHQALTRNNGAADEKRSARDNALDCARRAVAIDPAYKLRLLSISEPGGMDDDLSDLRSDPDFQKLIGTRPPGGSRSPPVG
jgi:hypothetical protein